MMSWSGPRSPGKLYSRTLLAACWRQRRTTACVAWLLTAMSRGLVTTRICLAFGGSVFAAWWTSMPRGEASAMAGEEKLAEVTELDGAAGDAVHEGDRPRCGVAVVEKEGAAGGVDLGAGLFVTLELTRLGDAGFERFHFLAERNHCWA